jgi:two-component system, OmpR family, alkaline phosphatase synthesis response regulator PhoP
MRILLVEDEENIKDVIKLNLEMEDYEVVATDNGKDALKYAKEQHFDLLVLDVMLPEIDGYQICEQVRLTNREVPIIFLTAKDAAQDRVMGLKKGADDYLTKPFNLEELLLRVDNLIRRTSKDPSNTPDEYRFGGNWVNFATYEAEGNPGKFTLTKKEAMLLKLLIDREGEVVSRQQILQSVWGYDVYPSTRTIDNFILSFRKYFEQDPKNPQYFLSVRGVGYKFVDSVKEKV